MDLTLRPINILIGSNGVGKTNFISFFRLVNNIYEQRLGNYTMRHRAESLLHYGIKNTDEVKGYLQFSDNAYAFTIQPRNNGSMFLAKERSYYQNNSYTVENIDESHIKDSSTHRDKWLRAYLDSYKIYHFHDTSEGAPLRTEAVLNDTRILRTDGGNLPTFLYMLMQQYPKALKRIEMAIQSVMPYFERHPVAITKLSGLIKSPAARGCQIIISTQSVNLISNFEAEDVTSLSSCKRL